MNTFRTLPALTVLFAALVLQAEDWPQWRGPQRDGTSPEKGLMAEWPKDGPRLMWQRTDIGSGYSTPAVVGDRIYVLSNEGLEDEFVQALDVKDGSRLWKTRLGKAGNPEQKPNYAGSRSTPTVEGDLLFALGSDGDLVCLETNKGEVRWQKNLRTEFGGQPGIWAYSESPLIDGNALICSPGGSNAAIVALNKMNGAVIWKCAVPGGDNAAYASPIVVEADGVKQYVQVLENGLVGVNAKTGAFLWRYDKAVSIYKATIPSPDAKNDVVYTAGAGKGGGTVRLKKDGDKMVAEPVYFSPKLPTAIGGAVLVGDLLFGTTAKAMLCADFKTGDVKWEDNAIGAASLCFADGRLYLHGENGEVALVEPVAEGYFEKGRFTPPAQPKRLNPMEKAWAYPIIANGRLYLRDQNSLWCYDVKAAR
jgi:outer membrane protein assembly factor BamB